MEPSQQTPPPQRPPSDNAFTLLSQNPKENIADSGLSAPTAGNADNAAATSTSSSAAPRPPTFSAGKIKRPGLKGRRSLPMSRKSSPPPPPPSTPQDGGFGNSTATPPSVWKAPSSYQTQPKAMAEKPPTPPLPIAGTVVTAAVDANQNVSSAITFGGGKPVSPPKTAKEPKDASIDSKPASSRSVHHSNDKGADDVAESASFEKRKEKSPDAKFPPKGASSNPSSPGMQQQQQQFPSPMNDAAAEVISSTANIARKMSGDTAMSMGKQDNNMDVDHRSPGGGEAGKFTNQAAAVALPFVNQRESAMGVNTSGPQQQQMMNQQQQEMDFKDKQNRQKQIEMQMSAQVAAMENDHRQQQQQHPDAQLSRNINRGGGGSRDMNMVEAQQQQQLMNQQQRPPNNECMSPHHSEGMNAGGPNLQQQLQQQHDHNANGIMAAAFGPQGGGPPPPGGMRELRVEDALLYLDDVKREFKDRPAIYNEFLAIMKNFKSQEVDTPGVIARVSKLFRGYDNLILGFNTFLPDGYKISAQDLRRIEAKRMAEEAAEEEQRKRMMGMQGSTTGSNVRPQQQQQRGSPQHVQQQQQPDGMQQQQQGKWGQQPGNQVPSQGFAQETRAEILVNINPSSNAGQEPRTGLPPQPPVQQPPAQHQAVEFDHAISYVTTIKKRFANDPNTYHSFLEILHTYQKEQRGIKEVLEQVAHLFQDHPDLLKEFTFFLPDAVQEQAKERLHRAAAESESRLASLRQQRLEQQQQQGKNQGEHFVDVAQTQMLLEPSGRKRMADGQLALRGDQSFVYNSAVERQFFDSAREALASYSRDGGQAWAEFLKCLDMYAQEILSKSEMLGFVEPLLGKRNNNLYEEFKRILTAAGAQSNSTQMMEDAWYSVPLSEIDFGKCRRCSPSYRALPRDYPAHPCSDRSEAEAKVLNDVWVSLPVGSEESYTFRHMRRNTYEETLFRVEDERFEIDMVIDSNAATLQRLMPIAEEIAILSREEAVLPGINTKSPGDGTGIGGKKFQYIFDKKILGVINRNSISRLYGDSGKEMLELMVKNPTVAIPLVMSRLRDKDTQWREVRDRLNRHWKELAEQNYYKSVDHRSLTWRTVDKRAIGSRTLIMEIKDRAENGGKEGKEALRQKLDKAKDEHGTFYEVTVGEKLTQNLDLTFLPKPDRRLFTPHLSLMYNNVSWAQRDAYRILAFALERGPISPADKERCHRLWVEFLGPWFDLSLNWMQKPAVSYQESSSNPTISLLKLPESSIVSEEEGSVPDDDANSGRVKNEDLVVDKDTKFTDHHPLPAGAHVSTVYGEGVITKFRRDDQIYSVKLGFGAIAYLRPATVLCSMLPVEKSAYTRQLRADDRTKLARPNDQLAFGTQSLYLFFRLHQILVNRLNTAKKLAYAVSGDQTLQSMVEQMPNSNPKAVGRGRYEAYLSLVYALLDGGVGGSAEGGKYEDRVRSLLGHGAYELATMDKLISHIWKDIQSMANDETMWNLVQLYRRHMLAGSFQPEAFRQEAAYLSDGEPMYAFQHCPLGGQDESVLHMEYVGVMDDDDDDDDEDDDDNTAMGMEIDATSEPQHTTSVAVASGHDSDAIIEPPPNKILKR